MSTEPVQVGVDTYSATLKGISPERICEYFGLQFVHLGYGGLGYRQQYMACDNGLKVLFDGHLGDEMGCHVVISGKGMAHIDVVQTMRDFRKWGGNHCRVDLCIDVKQGPMTCYWLEEALKECRMVSRAKQWRPEPKYNLQTGATMGYTVYVGSRTSETFFRAYDKALQLGLEDEQWHRFEFEYKGDTAAAIVDCVLDKPNDLLSVMNNHMRIVTEKPEKNVQRAEIDPIWASVFGKNRVKLVIQKIVQTVDRIVAHVVHQWSANIAAVTEHYGGCIDWIHEVLIEGQSKYKDKHRRLILTGAT